MKGGILSKNISKLIRNLSDPNESKRRAAAEALSNADIRAVYPLIKALRDSNAGVQDAAMRSLIAIGGETTAYMILPLLREDAFLRNTAMIILKEIGYETIPLLRNLLKDKDDDIRKFAIDLIIDINHCDYLDDLINLLREDKNSNVRASAAKALGIFKYEKAIPQLINALTDDEWVCFSALEALSLFKDESTIDSIASLLHNKSETIRYAAIETLGKLGIKSAESYLSEHFLKADDFEKNATVKSLLMLGAVTDMPGGKDILLDIYINGEWQDRLIALKGLVALQDTNSIPIILDIAGSLDPTMPDEMDILQEVKENLKRFDCSEQLLSTLNNPNIKYRAKTIAIEIIEDQRCKAAVPYLLKLFEQNLRDVKRAAIKAIGEINSADSIDLIMDACSDEDSHIRKYAISAIGKIGYISVIDNLFKLLDKEIYTDVKEEIVKAILSIDENIVYGRLGEFDASLKELIARNAEGIEILLALSDDPNINVMLSAINSLGVVDDERATKKLIQFLKDENAEIRKTALMSLSNKKCCLNEILPMLNDSNMWVKLYALRVLGNSLDPGVIEFIQPILKSDEIPLVLAAIDALSQIAAYNNIHIASILKPLLAHKNPAIKKKVMVVGDVL